MEVFFKKELIGNMKDIYNEQCWVHGKFIPDKKYFKYKEFFNAIVCEEGIDETKFVLDLFDENNWVIKNEKGFQGICIPAIYEDGDISIRYR